MSASPGPALRGIMERRFSIVIALTDCRVTDTGEVSNDLQGRGGAIIEVITLHRVVEWRE
jgi:hypothetical protein